MEELRATVGELRASAGRVKQLEVTMARLQSAIEKQAEGIAKVSERVARTALCRAWRKPLARRGTVAAAQWAARVSAPLVLQTANHARSRASHSEAGYSDAATATHLQVVPNRVHCPSRCEFLNVAPLVPGFPSLDARPRSPGETRHLGVSDFGFRVSDFHPSALSFHCPVLNYVDSLRSF